METVIESNENVKSKLGPRPYKFYNYGAGSKEANLKINQRIQKNGESISRPGDRSHPGCGI